MDRAWFASKPVGLASKQWTSVLSRTAALLFDISWVHMSKIRLPRIRLLLNVYIQVMLILRYRGQFEQHIKQGARREFVLDAGEVIVQCRNRTFKFIGYYFTPRIIPHRK